MCEARRSATARFEMTKMAINASRNPMAPGARVRRVPAKTKPALVEARRGNVFRDLGRPDADERQLKVQLAMRIVSLLADTGLTQAQMAHRLGIAQPHVLDLMNYRLSRFSVDWLIRFATLLDRDVEIVIRPRAPQHATGTVSVLMIIDG
jgi:predicted XRE-type DNA-binding protein